jgi:hypothetical protein
VFWKPEQKSAHGTSLLDDAPTEISYFIVDGQQRIRSLHSVARDEALWDTDDDEDASDPDQPLGPNQQKVWCVNLTRVEGFSSLLKPHGKEYSMFLFAVDPTRADKRSPSRTNILPLRLFAVHESWQTLTDYHKCILRADGTSSANADLVEPYLRLRQRILGIRQETFFVSIVQTNDVAEVVALYNRINSGGKRVEIEERAFGKLVALQPSTWPCLAELFAAIHGPDGHVEGVPRDDVLKRGQERSFGFKSPSAIWGMHGSPTSVFPRSPRCTSFGSWRS